MKCKSCNHEAHNQGMGEHYKKNPTHRPSYKPILVDGKHRLQANNGHVNVSVEDKIRDLHRELIDTLNSNELKIASLHDTIETLEAENERLRKCAEKLDPTVSELLER